MKPVTLCTLHFGVYYELAERCLRSIHQSLLHGGTSYVEDIRIGANSCSPFTRDRIDGYVRKFVDLGVPVTVYEVEAPALKYPTMRRMFNVDDPHIERPLAENCMWFDDDSFLKPEACQPTWWNSLVDKLKVNQMVGMVMMTPMSSDRWAYVQKQPWCDKELPKPPPFKNWASATKFCTGGWWAIKSKILQDHNWPIPQLRHNGGDSLLGELFRHKGYKHHNWHDSVCVNADDAGRHNKRVRRGYTELPLGYAGADYDTSHQAIDMKIKEVSVGARN